MTTKIFTLDKQKIKVYATERETNEIKVCTLNQAIEQLSGYWKIDKIEEMLLNGLTLFTPYTNYSINK